MESLPKINDYMDREVPTLAPETRVLDAVDFLLDNKVTGAPVVDSSGALVGIITETDLLKLVTEGIQAEPPAAQTVAEYMTKDVITVTPDVDIYYVAGLFIANRFRRLPVVEEGQLRGVVTSTDMLVFLECTLENYEATIEQASAAEPVVAG